MEERIWKYSFLAGLLMVITGALYFLFFILSNPQTFQSTAIGKLPAGSAMFLIIVGAIMVLVADEKMNKLFLKNRFVKSDKPIDPRVYPPIG